MTLFSFYRKATPEPPTMEKTFADSKEKDLNASLEKKYPSQLNPPLSGTPALRPHITPDIEFDSPETSSFVDPFEPDGFETQGPANKDQSVPIESILDFQAATDIRNLQGYSEHRGSEATTLCPAVGPMAIPVELWELIFGFVSLNTDDDSFQSVNDLRRCALTCRVWSMIALPMLYRTHGWGVFMPKYANRGLRREYFPTARCIDFYMDSANIHMLKLWRTLLLSCYTASRPTSASRFTTFTGATLFPYITYVHHLDARTLVMVLSGIMKSQTRNTKCKEAERIAQLFFSGALGAFEVSGDVRGDRMIVGGPEYRVQSPVGGKEVKLFVGDTALMIMDFLYPYLTHLKGFTIPELGQLRVHTPITMSHPGDLMTSFTGLNSLVISSGWMVSAGLGKAIASVRPTLLDGPNTSTFNLTILDWRFKTHYDPDYHHEEDWEANREDYRWTQRSATDFFNALNPNSVTSMDLDFEVRYNRQNQGELGSGGATAIRQSQTLKAFRLAHLRTSDQKLHNMFRQMAAGGFRPVSLRLDDLYNEPDAGFSRDKWSFPSGLFDKLEDLSLSRFSGMFHILFGIIQQNTDPDKKNILGTNMDELLPIKSLKLHYNERHIRESRAETFIRITIPALSSTLTVLKLIDTDHDLASTVAPRRRTHYGSLCNLQESPLESLVNLRTLVLHGDISSFLIGKRLPQIMAAFEKTIEAFDICVSLTDLTANDPFAFASCRRLETLILREWSWDVPTSLLSPYGIPGAPVPSTPSAAPSGLNYSGSPFYSPIRRLTVEILKQSLMNATAIEIGPGSGSEPNNVHKRLVLRELGISGGLLEVAGEEHWGEIASWAARRGVKFWWNAHEIPRI